MVLGLLIGLLILGQLILYFSNVIWNLLESIRGNGGFRPGFSPDAVDFDCEIIDLLLIFGGFLRVFDDFGVEAVGQFHNSLLGFGLKLLNLLIELMIILSILSLILLSESFHFKDNWPELLDLFFTLLIFVILVIPHLVIQQLFIVLNTRL